MKKKQADKMLIVYVTENQKKELEEFMGQSNSYKTFTSCARIALDRFLKEEKKLLLG